MVSRIIQTEVNWLSPEANFKLHSRSLLVNILQLIEQRCPINWSIRKYAKIKYNITKFCKINRISLFTATVCLHLSITILNV